MTIPTRAVYQKGQWHEVVPGAVITQITHNSGGGGVVYTESPSTPAPYNKDVPSNAKTKVGDIIYFNSVEAGDNIYFWPLSSTVSLTITKVEA